MRNRRVAGLPFDDLASADDNVVGVDARGGSGHADGVVGRTGRPPGGSSACPDRPQRDELYRLIRRALELPDGAALARTPDQVRAVLERPLASRRLRMVAPEFLRRYHHFRA